VVLSEGLELPITASTTALSGSLCRFSYALYPFPAVLRVAGPSSVVFKLILALCFILLAWRVSWPAFCVAVSGLSAVR
jgi:hypothetical protein